MSDLDTLQRDLTRLRRELHVRPELSGHEEETAALVARALAAWGPAEILRGLGGHGLAAIFPAPGSAAGPTVMLRCELDALPLDEAPACSWPSQHPGIAHKCGHDGHMAILCGVARRLAASPPPRGKVILLFQPAEETGTGAAALLADPRFRSLDPDWVFALHNLPGYPLWSIVCREGAFAAGTCGLRIRLKMATGHAIDPEHGSGLDRAMGRLVTELIGLSSDQEDRLALVTVTHARTADPGQAEILATIRARDNTVLQGLKEEAARRACAAARPQGLELQIGYKEDCPSTLNDTRAVGMIIAAAEGLDLEVLEPEESPFRWAEDFGLLTDWRPGAMFGLGAGRNHPPLHGPGYDFADDLIIAGVMMMEKIIAQALGFSHP